MRGESGSREVEQSGRRHKEIIADSSTRRPSQHSCRPKGIRSTQHVLLLLLLLCVACSSGSGQPKPSATAAVVNATPVPGAISEGVHVTGADAWQVAGITGKGV